MAKSSPPVLTSSLLGQPSYADVPMGQILEPPHQLRSSINPQKIADLADDIAAQGLLQPIGVACNAGESTFTIAFGHCRFLAHRLLERPTIPAKVWPIGTDLLGIAVAENHFRTDLNPIEDALGMRRFVDRGEPLSHVARRYRCSEGIVRSRLALLEYPEELQTAIAAGELSISVATALSAVDHVDYRKSLIDEASRTGASARIVNVWVSHYQADRTRIVANHLSVEAIVERRSEYVVYVKCDGCAVDTRYDQTTSARFCARCRAAIDAAMSQPQ